MKNKDKRATPLAHQLESIIALYNNGQIHEAVSAIKALNQEHMDIGEIKFIFILLSYNI